MSYIVKNCPAFTPQAYEHCCSLDGNYKCEYCTDCVIKRVIDKCKCTISDYSNLEILRTACETSEAYGKANIAEQILQLFDIEDIKFVMSMEI